MDGGIGHITGTDGTASVCATGMGFFIVPDVATDCGARVPVSVRVGAYPMGFYSAGVTGIAEVADCTFAGSV